MMHKKTTNWLSPSGPNSWILPVRISKQREQRSFRSTLSALLIVCFIFSGCTSLHQNSQSKNFSKRLTNAQNHWRFSSVPFQGDRLVDPGPGPLGELQGIMNRLVYVSPLRGYSIRVVVAQNKQINAGTNGRLIYMNSGLLDVIWHDKDLVAAVLAHELGHIIAHHTSYQNNREGAASAIRTASPMMSWTWLGSLIAMGLRESLTMTNRSFGRYDEKEADMIAAYLTHQAGFDPDALNRFFGAGLEKNKVLSGNVTIPITNYANPQAALQSAGLFVLRASPLYKTHPPSKSRTKALTKMSALLKGEKTPREIKQSDRWIWRIHQTLKKRTPKTEKSVSS